MNIQLFASIVTCASYNLYLLIGPAEFPCENLAFQSWANAFKSCLKTFPMRGVIPNTQVSSKNPAHMRVTSPAKDPNPL